jgi:hypothetical protein
MAAIAEFTDTNTQLGGFLDGSRAAGAEIVVRWRRARTRPAT